MIDAANVFPVSSQEMTTRYLVSKRYVNQQTKTVKANAFIPKPHVELSVTRLIQITDDEIWAVGRRVASGQQPARTLRGRADVLAATFLGQNLEVVAAPVQDNPNHAKVTGWPSPDEESGQLMIAKEIAAVAKFVPTPDNESP